MIVELNGRPISEARGAMQHFLERTSSVRSLEDPAPRSYTLSPKAQQLERARMRVKVARTKTLRAAILAVLDGWRDVIVDAANVREAASDAGDSAEIAALNAELDAAVADGVLTAAQRREIAQRLKAALKAMNPKELTAAIVDAQQALFQAGRESGAAEVGISWDEVPQRAIDALYHQTLTFSRAVVDRETGAVKFALMQGLTAGDGIPQITQRIRDVFDDGMHIFGPDGTITRVIPNDTWAEMVARTETSRAMNAGVFAAYRQAGVTKVTWVAADDERTCPECGDADGATVALGQTFPAVDVDGPPAHPSCRCTTIAADEEYQ